MLLREGHFSLSPAVRTTPNEFPGHQKGIQRQVSQLLTMARFVFMQRNNGNGNGVVADNADNSRSVTSPP